jgi:hypothetical protein
VIGSFLKLGLIVALWRNKWEAQSDPRITLASSSMCERSSEILQV